MAALGPLIQRTPVGIEIRGRRRVNSAAELEALLDQLQNMILSAQERDEDSILQITDCDLSQCKLPADQWENLFAMMGGPTVRVQRYRLFGCPSINDEVVRRLGEFFKLLTGDAVPHELHLSDCSITAEGFVDFIGALEENDSFPRLNLASKKRCPLYLRLENNFIDEAVIAEKVQSGVIRQFKKQPGTSWAREDTTAKVDLVCVREGQYQQKSGPPPAPEEHAGPSKQVWDKSWEAQQAQKGAAKGAWGQQPWGKACGKGAPQWPAAAQWPGAAQWPAAAQWAAPQPQWGAWPSAGGKGQVVAPRPGMMAQPGPVGSPLAGLLRPGVAAQLRPGFAAGGFVQRPAQMTPRPVAGATPFSAFGGKGAGASKGAASVAPLRGSGAADRSRTPAPRQPASAPRPEEPPLPHPWEEHWSDEYLIPYFWNSETGDSLWERPTA